jgi:hypothetical protein
MRRALAAAAMVLIAGNGLSACGHKQTGDLAALKQALDRTAETGKRFVYSDDGPDGQLTVRGVVADDFRYKALLSIDGKPAFEEVSKDDAVADRVLDPRALKMLSRVGAVQDPTLASGQWLLDDAGAPSLLFPAGDKGHPIGADPVVDALTVFTYVREAAGEAALVRKFNPNDLSYKPKEDPFPKPGAGSGVIRYDLVRAPVPRPQDTQGSAFNQAVPGIQSFRKMSVYVKNGLVVQVLEDIDVVSRLEDLRRNYDLKLSAGLGTAEQVKVAIAAINTVRVGQGLQAIRVRTMSLQLQDVGTKQAVDLPAGAVPGSVASLENRGTDSSLH